MTAPNTSTSTVVAAPDQLAVVSTADAVSDGAPSNIDQATLDALRASAEQIATLTGEHAPDVFIRLCAAASKPAAPTPAPQPLDRDGRPLVAADTVLIPAVIDSVNGDICVVKLGDPMPAYSLTLETKDVVKDKR